MKTDKYKSVNSDPESARSFSKSQSFGEDYPFFGKTKERGGRGCKLTICLTFCVILAASLVVLMSLFIANKQQISADLLLDIESVAADFAFWDPSKQVLYWVDRQLYQIHMYNPANNSIVMMQFNHTIGVVVPRVPYNDSVIITSGNYVATYNLTTGEEDILAYMTNTTSNSNSTQFTDGRCDPNGALWAGASYQDMQTQGTLYKIDPFLSTVAPMLRNISTPGGMAWSKDKKTFFFIDSKNSRVNAYTYTQTGLLVFQRVAFTVPLSFGILSGMSIDSTDSLWIAIIGPDAVNGTGRVCRYDAYLGQLQQTILLPVSGVTSCVFGGPNLDKLYITTRHKNGEVHSGGIYVASRLGAVGAYPSLYAT